MNNLRTTTLPLLPSRNYVHLPRPLPACEAGEGTTCTLSERALPTDGMGATTDQALLRSMLGLHVVDFSFF